MADAVNRLLKERDGLALGICNGFQALIKLGLVPYGEIRPITADDPTLTFNTVHRHQSMLVRTRVASNKSPWLSKCEVGDEHLIAISHGEGRFVCNDALLQKLIANGQVATQYVDLNCVPTMDQRYNPNGSVARDRGHHQPRRPRVRQDGPQRTQRRTAVQKRPRRQIPADFRRRRELL